MKFSIWREAANGLLAAPEPSALVIAAACGRGHRHPGGQRESRQTIAVFFLLSMIHFGVFRCIMSYYSSDISFGRGHRRPGGRQREGTDLRILWIHDGSRPLKSWTDLKINGFMT